MKHLFKSLFIILIGSFFIYSGLKAQRQRTELTDDQKILNAMHLIKSRTLYDYIDTLSSPEFEGRLTGHIGYDKSADWVIKKFKEWGIKPLGSNGGYLQKFPHPYSDVFKGCEVKMHIKQKDGEIIKNYEYVEEFIPGSTSGNGEIKAEVIYVGYGTTAPELDYDDYKGIDVKGKIVLMEKEAPVGSSHKDFLKWRKYSFHQYKLLNAVEHGAVGMLYNYGPIANPNNAYSEGFVYSHIGSAIMKDIFEGTGKNPREVVQQINEKLKPQSFNTEKVFTIKNNTFYHPDGIGSNVIGYIEGSDPVLKNEYIMVGGHLDFMGKCYEMMPGSNDNASAVVVTLGVAEAMSKLKIQLKRSVVFFIIGAEEAALKGVQYFLKNPTTGSLNNITGFINMDGVGIGHSISVGFGRNYPEFYSYLENANEKYIHRNMSGGFSTNLARPRQDAVFFDWYGIPVLSLGTWGNAGGANQYRYHTTYDNIANITPEILEDISQLLFIAIVDMANEDKLNFKRGKIKPEFLK
ncbi:M28 family peptidase [Bacteroidota bacterium]